MSNPTLASITAELEAVETAARGRGSLTCDHLAGRIANIRGELQQIAQPQPPAEAQAVASAEDRFEQFLQAAIARSPEPLRELAEYLSGLLDENQWPTADRLLLQIAIKPMTAPPSAPVGVECAPIRYFAYDSDCGDYNEFDTLPEAIADAQEALDYAGDDGWPEGGPSIYYGAVLGEAREVEGSRRPAGPGDHPDADFIVEYELKGSDALAQQPAAVDIGQFRTAVATHQLACRKTVRDCREGKLPSGNIQIYLGELAEANRLLDLVDSAAQQGGES